MITRLRKRLQGGFTLIELMIVVAIIGILAAVAIPQFMKYIKKSKTVEAVTAVKKMYEGGRTYFSEEFSDRTTGAPIARQFPADQSATPAANACCASGGKCSPSSTAWNTASWTALNFAIDDPHYYWYAWDSTGSNTTSKFTANAYGNLDCDGTNSTFEARASVNTSGELQGTGTVYQEQALE